MRLGYLERGAFAERAGVSIRTLSDLERGARERFRPETLAGVEAALGWTPGSILRQVTGGRIRRESDEDLAAVHAAWPRLGTRERQAIRLAAERLARRD